MICQSYSRDVFSLNSSNFVFRTLRAHECCGKLFPRHFPTHIFYFSPFLSCQQLWPQKPVSIKHLNTEETRRCRARPVCHYLSAHNILLCRALESILTCCWGTPSGEMAGRSWKESTAQLWCARGDRRAEGGHRLGAPGFIAARFRNTVFAGTISGFVKWLLFSFLIFSHLFLSFALFFLTTAVWADLECPLSKQ